MDWVKQSKAVPSYNELIHDLPRRLWEGEGETFLRFSESKGTGEIGKQTRKNLHVCPIRIRLCSFMRLDDGKVVQHHIKLKIRGKIADAQFSLV